MQCPHGHELEDPTAPCPTCGARVAASSLSVRECVNGHQYHVGNSQCPTCGSSDLLARTPGARSHRLLTAKPLYDWGVTFGGFVIGVSTLLGWGVVTGPLGITRTAFQLGDHASLTFDGIFYLAVGLAIVVIGLLRASGVTLASFVSKIPMIGAIVVLIHVYDTYGGIHSWANRLTSSAGGLLVAGNASVGPGLYLCGAGALVAAVFGAFLFTLARQGS